MARKINVRKILDELIKKASHNSIASSWHISKHSVSDVAARGLELGILPEGPVPDMVFVIVFKGTVLSRENPQIIMRNSPVLSSPYQEWEKRVIFIPPFAYS